MLFIWHLRECSTRQCFQEHNAFKLLRLFQFLALRFCSVFSCDYLEGQTVLESNRPFCRETHQSGSSASMVCSTVFVWKKRTRCQRISVNFEIWKHHSKLRFQIKCFLFSYTPPLCSEIVLPVIVSLHFIRLTYCCFSMQTLNSTPCLLYFPNGRTLANIFIETSTKRIAIGDVDTVKPWGWLHKHWCWAKANTWNIQVFLSDVNML